MEAPNDKPRVTINDVAAGAGVSRSAVSKVFNGRSGISPETTERIRAVARDLGWAPSSSAAALASASTRTIGMVTNREPDLLVVDPHFAVLIAGVEEALVAQDFGLQLYMVGEEAAAEEATYRRIAQQRRVDGVLLTESRVDDRRYALLSELRLPAVQMGRPLEGAKVEAVHPAVGDSGAMEAARYLYDNGHRRIAYVAGPDDRVHTHYRRRAFVGELARLGLGLSHSVTTRFREEDAAAAVLDLMRGDARPTAIMIANDSMAIAAIGALQRAGWRVPDDVSIIGHDDLPFGRWIHPRLTTIEQDLFQLGRASAIRLLQILGRTDQSVPALRSPALIVRESSGPAPDATPVV
ncbi:MAG: LacI family DNA-binding transcriptional regulator [Ancalomicrobiaceae bacterium]|nr:LacI family DNA-binding transcriptional regulator [Ancalomicrobiaceae bacterium]